MLPSELLAFDVSELFVSSPAFLSLSLSRSMPRLDLQQDCKVAAAVSEAQPWFVLNILLPLIGVG